MADKYHSFAELLKNEKEDRDIRIRLRKKDGTPAIIAPHGGKIEPGTSEIADAIAANDYSFYSFDGNKPSGNRYLHITSTRFDEPNCLALVRACDRVVAIHGEESKRAVVYVGGRDEQTVAHLRASLEENGFTVEIPSNPGLKGRDGANICNRTISGIGVQLELSRGLRESFFRLLTVEGRRRTTAQFDKFVAAVREGIRRGTAHPGENDDQD